MYVWKIAVGVVRLGSHLYISRISSGKPCRNRAIAQVRGCEEHSSAARAKGVVIMITIIGRPNWAPRCAVRSECTELPEPTPTQALTLGLLQDEMERE